MKKLLLFVVMILCTSTYSQDKPVWEEIRGDSIVTVMWKSKAIQLAEERVEFKYAKVELEASKELIKSLQHSIDKFRTQLEFLEWQVDNRNKTILLKDEQISSHERDVNTLKTELRREKRKKWYVAGGLSLIIATLIVAN